MHGRCGAFLCLVFALSLTIVVSVCAEQTSAPAQPSSRPSSASSTSSSSLSSSRQKHSHANDFLIRGTVFNEKAFAFRGAQLRIRRAGDKKFRWNDYTNSRGEFAIRVPQGVQYEMLVRAKGFSEQSKTIDARSGISDTNVVFRMEPLKGGKK
jgi:hypothetical protein